VPYDESHMKVHGYGCMNRHREYNWPPLSQEKYMLLGDSLIKYINRAKHLRIRSYPGANAYDLYNKIWAGELDVSKHSLLICAIGTNDLSNLKVKPCVIANAIAYLFHTIREFNPHARLMFSGLLVRPKNLGGPIEQRRRLVNKLVQRHCRNEDIHFIKSWKALMNQSDLRPWAYAKDGLHLSRIGARYLYRRIEGNICTIEGEMKL
jgi:lysophospholipase L1-like esterase